MPTALLPAIGASIRRECAARAIARSSDRASIRLSLMSGAGLTSYWVTTGPALRPTIRAGIPNPASFLTMISSLRAWTRLVAAGMERDRDVVERPRSAAGCTRSGPWSGGESPASVTSSGSRTGRIGATSVADAAPVPRAGANVLDVWPLLGTAAGMASSSLSPHTPVWPGDGGRGDRLAVRARTGVGGDGRLAGRGGARRRPRRSRSVASRRRRSPRTTWRCRPPGA